MTGSRRRDGPKSTTDISASYYTKEQHAFRTDRTKINVDDGIGVITISTLSLYGPLFPITDESHSLVDTMS